MVRKTKRSLPKVDKDGIPYISYSQVTTWRKSKRDYIRQKFFLEEEDNISLKKYGDFGTKVGESYENNDFSQWSKQEADFLKTLPSYDEFEKEINLDIGWAKVKGFIDSNTKEEDGYVKKLLDYKTGEISKVESKYSSKDYQQVDLYAAALRQEYGKIPKEGCVVIIDRAGNAFKGQELTLTGKAKIVKRELSDERCDEVIGDFKEVAENISDHFKVFNKLIQKDVNN